MRPSRTVLAAILATLLVAVPARAATVEGVVRTLAVIPAASDSGAREHQEQVLVAGDRTYVLRGEPARANTRARITGAVDGTTLQATDLTTLGAAPGVAPTGTTRLLVLLATWTAPDDVTPESAAAQVLGDGSAWYRDVSYGALGQVGDVTPWLTIDPPATGCYADGPQLLERAKAAAAARGYVLADYTSFLLYFPHCGGDAADKAGWAAVGAPAAWVNGTLDRRVVVHEEGHTYGLHHAHAALCTNGGLSGACTFEDYGDPYDAMGAGTAVGHFSAAAKDELGWMTGRTVDLTAGGNATLLPLTQDPVQEAGTAPAGPRAALIDAGGGLRLWIELRRATLFDGGLPGGATDGFLVHATGPGSGATDDGPVLLDVRPQDGLATDTATLRPGESWTGPDGVVLAAGAAGPLGAELTVRRVDVPGAPLATSATYATPDTVTLRWAPPTGVTPVTGYRISQEGGESVLLDTSARAWTSPALVAGVATTLTVEALGADGPGPPAVLVVTPGVPAIPTRVRAAVGPSGRATLRWGAPAEGAQVTGYEVRRDGAVEVLAPEARAHTFEGTGPATLRVRALGTAGPGPSAVVVVRPAAGTAPGAPVGLRATADGAGRITLSWSPPASGPTVTGFRVSRSGRDAAGVDAWSRSVGAGTLALTLDGLVTGLPYTVTVQAAGAGGTGPAARLTVTA